MLALTDSAVRAVKSIVSSSPEEVPASGGLRVVTNSGGARPEFGLAVVAEPVEGDELIELEGARLFLDQDATSLLDDKVLDATVTENQVAFTLEDKIE